MFKKIIPFIFAGVMLTACSSEESYKVTALQKKDKGLNCSQVQLEINEAEFYRKTAEQNKSPKMKSLLMPIGYVYTYVDAQEAVQQADSRIDYLNRIYDIMDCDNPAVKESQLRHGYGNNSYSNLDSGSYAANRTAYAPNQTQYKHSSEWKAEDEWYW